MRNAPSINVFKKNILKFIRLGPNKVFNIYILQGLKLLTRLHLGLSHLRGHKFNPNFSHCLDEICMCRKDIESTNLSSSNVPYLLMKSKSSWIKFVILTAHLLTKMKTLCYTLLFGKENMNDSENTNVLKETIEHILSSERFNVPWFE